MEQNILKVGKGSYVTDISFNASFPTFARLLDIFSKDVCIKIYISDHFPQSLKVSNPVFLLVSGFKICLDPVFKFSGS